jgi:hypothetical protein
MSAQWFGKINANAREKFRETPLGVGQITSNVNSGREKIRQHDDPRGASLHTASAAVVDTRLCKLQKGSFHDGVVPQAPQFNHDVKQIFIRLRVPAAVGDQQQSRFDLQVQACLRKVEK